MRGLDFLPLHYLRQTKNKQERRAYAAEREDKMEILGIASVAVITVIVYLIAMAVKATAIDNKWIPVICGIVGGILGAAAFLWVPIPEFPAKDILSAIAVGIVSGLAATGINQIGKQLKNKEVM